MKEFPTEVEQAATDFLIGEFQAPLEVVNENDYGMYDYREHLLDIAYFILGGQSDGKHNDTTEPDDKDEEKEE